MPTLTPPPKGDGDPRDWKAGADQGAGEQRPDAGGAAVHEVSAGLRVRVLGQGMSSEQRPGPYPGWLIRCKAAASWLNMQVCPFQGPVPCAASLSARGASNPLLSSSPLARRSRVWGIGDTTALRYYAAGCRTLEDLRRLEGLGEVQRVGLKYFEDFEVRRPPTPVPGPRDNGCIRGAAVFGAGGLRWLEQGPGCARRVSLGMWCGQAPCGMRMAPPLRPKAHVACAWRRLCAPSLMWYAHGAASAPQGSCLPF
jgi:hypothetical protein